MIKALLSGLLRGEKSAEAELSGLFSDFAARGAECFGAEYLHGENRGAVLLTSHDMSLSGAPIALKQFAVLLREKGFIPLVVSAKNGPLTESLTKEGIPAMVYKDLDKDDVIDGYFGVFRLAVVCTATEFSCRLINKLNGFKIPTIWWIHECRAAYWGQLNLLPPKLSRNIRIYCVGWYAQAVLNSFGRRFRTKTLFYGVPDMPAGETPPAECVIPDSDKITFCTVASVEPRKGQDILTEAIELLSPESLARSRFVFVGTVYHDGILAKIESLRDKYPDNVYCIGPLSHDKVNALYERTDCLICPSTDDPMPIVVAEAWQRRIPVICSENAGQAPYIEKHGCGILYRNNDPALLAKAMETGIFGEYDRDGMTARARIVFDTYFSEAVFRKKAGLIVDRLTAGRR